MLTTNDQPLQPHQQPRSRSRGAHDHGQAPTCPRCASTNTKFCYYNNYSLSQPRYLCKACRRHWTKGGSLRNVPVGGSYRRRSCSTSSNPHSHHDKGSPYTFNSGDNSSSFVEIDLAAVFANYINPCLSRFVRVDPTKLDSPPLESMSAVMEDQFIQSDSMNQVIRDINWSCFDLEGYRYAGLY